MNTIEKKITWIKAALDLFSHGSNEIVNKICNELNLHPKQLHLPSTNRYPRVLALTDNSTCTDGKCKCRHASLHDHPSGISRKLSVFDFPFGFRSMFKDFCDFFFLFWITCFIKQSWYNHELHQNLMGTVSIIYNIINMLFLKWHIWTFPHKISISLGFQSNDVHSIQRWWHWITIYGQVLYSHGHSRSHSCTTQFVSCNNSL